MPSVFSLIDDLETGASEPRTVITVFTSQGQGSGLERLGELFRGNRPVSGGTASVEVLEGSYELPVPNNLQYAYQQDWSAESWGIFSQLVGAAVDGIEGVKSSQDLISTVKDAGSAVGGIFSNQALARLYRAFAGAHVVQRQGYAHNPVEELLYRGPQLRQFTFEWEFAPRNESESVRVEQFADQLVYHQHPSLSSPTDTRSVFRLPDKFTIEFPNTRLPRMSALALTNVTVNYGGSGEPRFLEGAGHAAFINISASFLEFEPMTKESISQLNHQAGPVSPGVE